MTTAQREARAFVSQFHHRPFSVEDLEKALQMQGFSLVEYSRASNSREVTTLLTSLQLFDYAARQSAFAYQDANFRIVFLQENLSRQEKMILLSHELGHILCRHLDTTPITGPGGGVLQEQEANDFAAALQRYNRTCRPRHTAHKLGIAVLVVVLAATLILTLSQHRTSSFLSPQEIVYTTATGKCFHREDCRYVVGKSNTTAVTVREAQEDGYTPCTWCFGHIG